MNPIQMMQAVKNPQALLQQMMGNSQIMNNPIARNAMQMMQNGDSDGVEQMARNLCKEKGINPDEIFGKLKNDMRM